MYHNGSYYSHPHYGSGSCGGVEKTWDLVSQFISNVLCEVEETSTGLLGE